MLNYCGIRTDYIDYTVIRTCISKVVSAWNTHPRVPPSHIGETRPDYVLILPWNLKDEIMGQLSFIREWSGRFVIPIPTLEVL